VATTTIIIIMIIAMAMPATVAHVTDVVAMAIITTTTIIIQLVVLSKERPLTFMVLFMMSDYPTASPSTIVVMNGLVWSWFSKVIQNVIAH
jgi:hypothetical protein